MEPLVPEERVSGPLRELAHEVLKEAWQLVGPLERGRFLAMLGLPERTARRTLSGLLAYGILTSTGPRSAVQFAVPFRSLRFLFPKLWPEAEASAA